jgi:uncharacterized protein
MRGLSDQEMAALTPAERSEPRTPLPVRMVSSEEYRPVAQSRRQREAEMRLYALADAVAPKLGMSRRRFFQTASGMAAGFAALNGAFGPVFDVGTAEASTPELADERARALSGQFIMDMHTHFLRDDTRLTNFVRLRESVAAQGWNPQLSASGAQTIEDLKFDNYFKEIFLDSDTKIALLSGAPFDDPSWWLISNDAIQNACRAVNKMAGGTRMLGHAVITPKYPNWMDEVDRAIETLHPVSWKSYTIGDPFGPSKYAWRLDDEKLMYPFYEKAIKSGINTICIHKGLMPRDYESRQGLAGNELRDLPLCAASLAGGSARQGSAVLPRHRLRRMVYRSSSHSREIRRK